MRKKLMKYIIFDVPIEKLSFYCFFPKDDPDGPKNASKGDPDLFGRSPLNPLLVDVLAQGDFGVSVDKRIFNSWAEVQAFKETFYN